MFCESIEKLRSDFTIMKYFMLIHDMKFLIIILFLDYGSKGWVRGVNARHCISVIINHNAILIFTISCVCVCVCLYSLKQNWIWMVCNHVHACWRI